MSSAGVQSVEEYTVLIENLLAKARELKPEGGIEPALTPHDFGSNLNEIKERSQGNPSRNYAAIETACRNIFYDLLASRSIKEPSFCEVWNLLDVLSIFSDLEICEPSLLLWLVEELLDTQTIDGCRIIFDYLDSRRERITAKHFKAKSLIILRACNELLRRLSRAEDTVFCGRVFIFLFQSFPLGDRSSVNLRGEYHTENVTVYEDLPAKPEAKVEDVMDIDQNGADVNGDWKLEISDGAATIEDIAGKSKESDAQAKSTSKTVKFEGNEDQKAQDSQETTPDMDTLYPIFWSLQENFSTPTRLFEENNLESLKEGLGAAMRKFKQVHQEHGARGAIKLTDESKRGVKRKRNGQDEELAASFNPKYLTSRDLFELEISDLAFRRHILVQSLILVDFLLSLTPKAKKKLENTSNKSVLYNYTLSEENAKWATEMRNDIATYLQQGPEGKFYYRMVDTVLSRDKNWVHWKAEGCPPIQRDPVSAEDFAEAGKGATTACATKKIRSHPLGTLDLAFLSDTGDGPSMEKLKDPDRYTVPTAESFERPLADNDFELEMARTAEEKKPAVDAKASKLWRTLRIASRTKLSRFDKIDDGKNIKALFEADVDENNKKFEAISPPGENGEQTVRSVDVALAEGKPPDENGIHVVQQDIAVN